MKPVLHSLLKFLVARSSKNRGLCVFLVPKLLCKNILTLPLISKMKMGSAVESKELKRIAAVMQELGLSYAETLEVMHEISKDANKAQKLWRGEKKSKFVKIAIALITCPEPTPISETVGAAVLVAGLIQNRIKNSGLYVEDIYKTFQDVNNDILKIRQFRK